jgi:hypothetical protein
MTDIDAQIEEAKAELVRANQAIVELSSSTDIVPAHQDALAAKKQMAAIRVEAHRQRQIILANQRKVKDLLARKMDEERQALEAMTKELGPLQELVSRLEEGIWTINLFFGRDEQIVTLLDGRPAPRETPIHIRQRVLAMDQETAINPGEAGIDASNIDEFDAWLLADPAHLEQVLPETKGIVAIQPRFDAKIYEDPWKTEALAKANQQTYFLVRNGGKLYRTWTEFNAGHNLTPTADEFNSFFTYKDSGGYTRTLEPGSPAWEKAEKKAGARQRHFMRVGLILEGLLQRTAVFHPLPEERVSFIDHSSIENGTIVFINDMERQLETGRPTFHHWLSDINSRLTVGQRVIGAFNTVSWRGASDARVRPRYSHDPASNVIHYILDKEGDDDAFVIRYNRDSYGSRRASCLLYKRDTFILAFDQADVGDMEYYLQSRSNRHEYAYMFPVLRSAIAAKRAEEQAEAPFRDIIAGRLMSEFGMTVEDAREAIPDLISWYKYTNKYHRPLVWPDPPAIDEELFVNGCQAFRRDTSGKLLRLSRMDRRRHNLLSEVRKARENEIASNRRREGRAISAIVNEQRSRLGLIERKAATDQAWELELVEHIKRQHPDSILIARRRSGRYVTCEAANSDNVWVHETEYNRHGRRFDTEKWRLLSKKRIASVEPLYQSPRLADWNLTAAASEFLTDDEIEELKSNVPPHVRVYKRIEGVNKYVNIPVFLARWDDIESCLLYYAVDHDSLVDLTNVDVVHPTRIDTWDLRIALYRGWTSWRRVRGGFLEVDNHMTTQTVYGDEPPPWEEHESWIIKDLEAIAVINRALNYRRQIRDSAKRVLRHTEKILNFLLSSYEEQQWEQAKALFVDDYGTDAWDLWEDHKKSIKIHRPSVASRFVHRVDETAVHYHLNTLIEEGKKIDGQTLRQTGFEGEPSELLDIPITVFGSDE